ncbi:nucleotidyltransferase domain protein (macronuclear) [Tetrahymena thermophila SB210]|uniref:Nucleotidyltransferase domain protein n=1 Tax=Tetrahymena thermophila (strain SB210) TaxID=312017 RepID=Q23K52_TETTS|nr:nucleotidyltransferase domain protein [Tetrahymena thermophila SB210]EAR96991.3 nucleotidyltransferase domain protein [Tetrahymena thermophila SB210]|eukprot:XP_001017236.3 nucleotidyltransferase domain protein [Tetrahymena thermophila SB210]
MDNKKQANNDIEEVRQLFGQQPQVGAAQTSLKAQIQNCSDNLNLNQIIKDGKLEKFEEYFKNHIESKNEKPDKSEMSQILLKLIDNYYENKDHQQCAVYLINKVDINPNYHPLDEDDGVTLLMKAAEKYMVQVVKLLLQKNDIQVNQTDRKGETALIHSVRCQKPSMKDHLLVIELLLEHGADPNTKYIDDSKGEMPLLHACVINQWADTVNLLIKYKIDINQIDKQGDTATHVAARRQKRPEILESLLTCNPDLKIQNNNHQTALDVAQEDKKKLIQSKIHEQEEKLRQQQLESKKQDQNKQAEQQIKDVKQDEQSNNFEEKQVIQNQIEQVQDELFNTTATESKINYEIVQESEQKSKQIIQNTQQNQTSQIQQQASQKSEDEGKSKNNSQQSKDQKESGLENGNINGFQQQQQGQVNQNTNSSLQSKKQLNQASTEFQLNSQQANQSLSSSSSQQNNASNNLINQNQQTNFSSPTQSFNSMQNIKANNSNLNSSINSQNNINKNPQYGSQYQNYSGQQHLDRSKNLPNQQLQQGQITATLNRGASNFNYPQQKSPISQVGIPNQNIMPGLNGNHQQILQKNQVQTPIPQNQVQNNQQLQQTPSPSNVTEEYPFWPESVKLYDLMKTSIITKINPNKISIDISDDSKRNDLNQKAQFISYFTNIDKMMNQLKNENKEYKIKNQQLEQENQSLKQKYEDLLRLTNSKNYESEIPNQIDPQQTTNLHIQGNNKDPFNCANDILDWDQDLMFRKHGDPNVNYFKSTQMLSKKELIPHLNEEIREFEREVNEYNKRMEPTFDELIKKVEDIIKQQYPNIKLNKYGSYATKLCLPWSDIDIVVDASGVNDSANQSFLKTIESLLLAHSDLVQEIFNVSNTSVPVLKVTCTQKYDYKKLDITILEGKHNGIKCVDLVNNYINAYQHLKPLVLVLKQFLHSLEMNDTYKGGLSSYSLILMLVYFIQQKQNTDDLPDNEAELLIQFLLFYGFDEQKSKYIAPKKVDSKGEMDMSQPPNIPNMNNYAFSNFTNDQKIHIMDPQNYQNNVARSSFHYNKIKTAMACSYTIMHTMYVCHSCKNQREIKESQKKPCLILKRLFYLPGKIMDIQDAWVIHPIQQQQYPFYNQYAPY